MNPTVGEVVTYQTIDLEAYSRGLGIHRETKASTIVSLCYKMANGDIVDAKHILPLESKCEEAKKD